jgi:hypothetical protein
LAGTLPLHLGWGRDQNEAPVHHGSYRWQPPGPENLFVNYLSRIHREEVSQTRLLILPAYSTMVMASCKVEES